MRIFLLCEKVKAVAMSNGEGNMTQSIPIQSYIDSYYISLFT